MLVPTTKRTAFLSQSYLGACVSRPEFRVDEETRQTVWNACTLSFIVSGFLAPKSDLHGLAPGRPGHQGLTVAWVPFAKSEAFADGPFHLSRCGRELGLLISVGKNETCGCGHQNAEVPGLEIIRLQTLSVLFILYRTTDQLPPTASTTCCNYDYRSSSRECDESQSRYQLSSVRPSCHERRGQDTMGRDIYDIRWQACAQRARKHQYIHLL